jgi:hypothetical protein
MGAPISKDTKIKRLEKQLKKFKDNPEKVKRLTGRLGAVTPKDKKKKN